MYASRSRRLLGFLCLVVLGLSARCSLAKQERAWPAKSEVELRERYEHFADSLDTLKITREYPKAIQNLLSGDPHRQSVALAILSVSGEVEALPWMVPSLDSPDSQVRVWAGAYIEKLVSATILKERRNRKRLDHVVLDPLGPNDTDFRPLAWVIYRMLDKKDGNTEGYAATLIGYIGLKEFEPELRELLASQHPAVTDSVKFALELLQTQPNTGIPNPVVKPRPAKDIEG